VIVAVTLAARQPATTAWRWLVLGVTAGLVYFAGTLYWVVTVMTTYGGLATPVAVLVGALLVAYLSLYLGLFAAMLGLTVRRAGVAALWLAPCYWVAMEWLRSWIGGGFPWALLGTSQATVLPIVQLASVTGVYGLSFLIVLVSTAAAALTLTTRRAHRIGAAAVAALLVAIAAAGTVRVARSALTQTGTVLRVGLVQGDIEQDRKWNPAFRDRILETYLSLSRRVIDAGAGLVLWPEAATPFYFDAEPALAAPIRQLAAVSRTPFIIGTDEFERGTGGEANRYYNAAVLVGADGRSRGSYRKMQLVPFGEYVPLKRLLFFVGPLVEAVSDFSAGTEAFVFDADGRRLSVAICYEVVYPAIARTFVNEGSQLLATITNDAWFGRSSAPYQHFEQASLRAVENGRYLVRSANTGISGAVDPYGRVIATTPLFEPAATTVDVRLLDQRTIYSYIGDVVAWLSAAATALTLVVVRRGRS
jgi:apolipoprotein N-acyltransferase